MSAKRKKRTKNAVRPTRDRVAGVDYAGASRTVCPTGKWAFPDKAGARTLVKALRRQGESGMHAYDCPECFGWHAGHTPAAVRIGLLPAREVYGDGG